VPVVLKVYPGRGHAATVAALAWVLRWRSPTLRDVGAFMRTLPGPAGTAGDCCPAAHLAGAVLPGHAHPSDRAAGR
jgi:hypothetical protein